MRGRFSVALSTETAPEPLPLAISVGTGTGGIAVAFAKTAKATPLPLAISVGTGAGSVAIALGKTTGATPLPLAISVGTGAGAVSVALAKFTPTDALLAISVGSGAGSVAVALSKTAGPGALDLAISIGTGAGSVAVALRVMDAPPPPPVILAVPASLPLFLLASPTGATGIDLTWTAPEDDGGGAILHYEVRVDDGPWESTGSPALRWRVRGLAIGHRYRFRVRAVNAAGVGDASDSEAGIPARGALPAPARSGDGIPLIVADRQSLIVRLSGIECRLQVWYQPGDGGWYASLEIPVGTPVSAGRRLTRDSAMLARQVPAIPGDIYCRVLDAGAGDPGRLPWGVSHELRYEL